MEKNLRKIDFAREEYRVSEDGIIYGIFGKQIKPKIRKNREYVQLYDKDGNRIYPPVSRIVAIAFCKMPKHLISNDINNLDVHHIDGNPRNNNYKNLLWVSKEEHRNLHLNTTGNPIAQIKGNEIIRIYGSCLEASKETGIPVQNIYDVAFNKERKGKKRRLTAGGFKWTNKIEGQFILSLQ